MKLNAILCVLFIACSVLPAWGMEEDGYGFHELDVTLDLESRTIEGTDRITLKNLPREKEVRLLLREGSEVTGIEMDGKEVSFGVRKKSWDGERASNVVTVPVTPGKEAVTMTVRFRGAFSSVEKAEEELKRGVSFADDGVMGPEGAFIPSSSYWFPSEEDALSIFRVRVRVPGEYTTVSEGEWKASFKKDGLSIDEWETSHPADGIDLVTGKYVVEEETHMGVKVYTFFYEEDRDLSSLYIRKTKEYLDLYTGLIGKYPFRKFAVVENFLPTGYGMPSFTLLGSAVLRLPFIPDTSLGHEIAHSWWGNSVFADYPRGNWVEALTTFVSDYLYERRKGEAEAAEFRFGKLVGYTNYAGEDPVSLRGFVDATGEASRAVGYNKGVMVFIMLEDLIGEDAFNRGLKEFYLKNAFKRASWEEMEEAFEKAYGKDLGWFFDQWVERAGGPGLSIEGARLKEEKDRYIVSFRVRQSLPAYAMRLPVEFRTDGRAVSKVIEVRDEVTEFSFELSQRPASFEVDPGYRGFRILSEGELPPSFSVVLGDKASIIVIPSSGEARAKYEAAARLLSRDYNLGVVDDSDPAIESLVREKSLFIFGGPGENRLFERVSKYAGGVLETAGEGFAVEGKTYAMDDTVIAVSLKNPHDPGKNFILFFGEGSRSDLLAKAGRLRFFTKQSYLILKGKEGPPAKGVFKGRKALSHDF